MTCIVYLHQVSQVTSVRIANQTGMDKMMISDLVKTLIKKKLITKKNNPKDGRSFIIKPTPLGKKMTNQAVRLIEDIDSEYIRDRDLSY